MNLATDSLMKLGSVSIYENQNEEDLTDCENMEFERFNLCLDDKIDFSSFGFKTLQNLRLLEVPWSQSGPRNSTV